MPSGWERWAKQNKTTIRNLWVPPPPSHLPDTTLAARITQGGSLSMLTAPTPLSPTFRTQLWPHAWHKVGCGNNCGPPFVRDMTWVVLKSFVPSVSLYRILPSRKFKKSNRAERTKPYSFIKLGVLGFLFIMQIKSGYFSSSHAKNWIFRQN